VKAQNNVGGYSGNMPFFGKIYRSYMTASVLSVLAVELVSMIASSASGRYAGSGIFAVIGLGTTGLGIFAIIKVVVSMGAYTACIELQGRHDTEKLCAVHTSSVIMMCVLWLLTGALFFCFMNPIADLLCRGNADIVQDLKLYLTVRILFFLPEMVSEILIVSKFKLMGKPRTVTIFTAVRLLVSLVSIAVLISLKVHWVLVVVLPNAIGFITVLAAEIFISRRTEMCVHRVKLSAAELKTCSAEIFQTGEPRGLNSLYFTIENLVYNFLLLSAFGAELFSLRGLAAAYGPILNVLMAMSGAAMPIIGVFLAEKNSGAARFVLKEVLAWMVPVTLVLTVLGILFRVQLSEYMGAGSGTALMWAPYAIACYFLSFIPCLIYDVIYNIHICNQRRPMIVLFDTLKRLLITLPLNIIACRTGSVQLMFLLPFLAPFLSVVALLLTHIFIRKGNRQISLFTLIDSRYEEVGESVLLTADNTDDGIVRLCDEAVEFGRNNGFADSFLYMLRMAFEEVLKMIGEEAYSGDPSMKLSVYLYLAEDEIITTIRFAGKNFDPVEYIRRNRNALKSLSENDSEIRDFLIDRLIFKACKKKIYDPTFGINNLTMIFDRKAVHSEVADRAV